VQLWTHNLFTGRSRSIHTLCELINLVACLLLRQHDVQSRRNVGWDVVLGAVANRRDGLRHRRTHRSHRTLHSKSTNMLVGGVAQFRTLNIACDWFAITEVATSHIPLMTLAAHATTPDIKTVGCAITVSMVKDTGALHVVRVGIWYSQALPTSSSLGSMSHPRIANSGKWALAVCKAIPQSTRSTRSAALTVSTCNERNTNGVSVRANIYLLWGAYTHSASPDEVVTQSSVRARNPSPALVDI
jgi:hypothetical protein